MHDQTKLKVETICLCSENLEEGMVIWGELPATSQWRKCAHNWSGESVHITGVEKVCT